MKLYVRDEIGELDGLLKKLLTTIEKIMEKTVIPICRASRICRRPSP